MGSDFAVAPGHENTVTGPNGVFAYGVYWPDDAPWSDDAIFRVVSDDGTEQHDFHKGDGVAAGKLLVFKFEDAQPGMSYRGVLVDGDITLSLFGSADLCALQHPADPFCFLPFQNPDDQVTGPESEPAPKSASVASADAPLADAPSAGDAPPHTYSDPLDPQAVANAASAPPSCTKGNPFA
jgi:hypothetical protein